MKKRYLAVLLLVCLLSLKTSARAANDWEYWSHFEIAIPIGNHLDFKIKPELRYNDDFDNHYYKHVGIGLEWKIARWFVLAPYYRQVEQRGKTEWKSEHRPHLNATFKWTLFGLHFSDRNRLEYRDKEDGDDSFRYRNKFTVKLPKVTRLKMQWYLADEPYFDFHVDELNKNRVYIGVDITPVRHLKAGIAYVFESRRKNDEWTNYNVCMTSLKYTF